MTVGLNCPGADAALAPRWTGVRRRSLGGYDEMVVGPDRPRAAVHEPVVTSLETLGRHELASRWENAKHSSARTASPTTSTATRRARTGRGSSTRSRSSSRPPSGRRSKRRSCSARGCSNAILADLYGPQRLLRERELPAELVLGNPAFLRRATASCRPAASILHLYAADLARAADGRWWVLADRTQAPSGAGYALENRIVMSRMLPEAFRDCRVQRLARFFRTLRDTLAALAPRNADNPRIVLLTPGPYNETYFEHAYLARYLGYTLVEGGDLTVRDAASS